MAEPCNQDQPMGDEPQVETRNLLGPPPRNPPPPPTGACMTHADDATEDWASDDDSQAKSSADKNGASGDGDDGDGDDDDNNNNDDDDDSNDDHSSQDSDSDASDDAISVLAQAAVEEAMESAVRQAQSSGANDANPDSINANYALSHCEQELTTMETNSPSIRPLSVLGSAGSLSQHYHDEDNSHDSEEDEGRWQFGGNSPLPSLLCPTSRCAPCAANQTQASNHSDEDYDEAEPLQEVTCEKETCLSLTCPSGPSTSDT